MKPSRKSRPRSSRRSYEMVKAKLTKSGLAGLGKGSPRSHGDTEKVKPNKGKGKSIGKKLGQGAKD